MEISVVIPTRNRPEQLRRLLTTLQHQTLLPFEIIVVDASDAEISNPIQSEFSNSIRWLICEPAVCIQRNLGINAALHSWIFLCDDDIEIPPDHFERLARHIELHPTCGAVAGRLRQFEDGVWLDQYPPKKMSTLLYNFIFQLSVWGSLSGVKTNWLLRPILKVMQGWYARRGNRESLAGWPLITDWRSPFLPTRFYSLGANLIRKDWLLNSPYDIVLDRSGIGDNYGVALGFPDGVHVLDTTYTLHHRAAANRIATVKAYYRRILALHYFIRTRYRNPGATSRWLCWSIIGLAMSQCIRFDTKTLRYSAKALWLILTARNPYLKASREGRKIVTPD
jgi:glycosyltransferase involved in cell wall biosynthesis